MARYIFLLSISVFLVSGVCAQTSPNEKFITGIVDVKNKLNVRVKPGKQYYIVATLKKGDEVKIYRKVNDWYEIAAPVDSSVWVAGHLMSNSRTRRAVNLRAGPSGDYQAYRTEPAGIDLQVISRKGHGGWFKIKPPVDLKAWVSSSYVTVDEYELEQLAKSRDQRKLILIDDKTGEFAGFLKDNDKKSDFILPFVKGADKTVALKGQIIPLKSGAVYVTHALINIDKKGNIKTIAYLHCAKASLNIWQEKIVCLTGIKKLVNGWKLPVIEVKTIAHGE